MSVLLRAGWANKEGASEVLLRQADVLQRHKDGGVISAAIVSVDVDAYGVCYMGYELCPSLHGQPNAAHQCVDQKHDQAFLDSLEWTQLRPLADIPQLSHLQGG